MFVFPGGQCLLALDVSGSPAPEEQQGPLLPAAVEAATTLSPLSGADKGESKYTLMGCDYKSSA